MNGQRVPRRARRAARPARRSSSSGRARTGRPATKSVPADLRVDHVYLVSCKYLSRIVVNASPQHLFDRLLKGGHGQRTAATGSTRSRPTSTPRCTTTVRAASVDSRCPTTSPTLDAEQRRALAHSFERGSAWPGDGDARYAALVDARRDGVGAALAGRDRRRTRRRCCGGCCASAARRTSCSARRRRASCGCASPRRGTGASTSSSALRRSSRAPAASRWSTGTRSCAARDDGAERRRARPRRDALEPRPLLRAARSQGVPRHAARRGSRLLPARLTHGVRPEARWRCGP